MDDHFQNVSYDIINGFLENVSDQCMLEKEKLWSLWNEMFQFPVRKEKKKAKSTDKKKDKKDEVKKEEEKQTVHSKQDEVQTQVTSEVQCDEMKHEVASEVQDVASIKEELPEVDKEEPSRKKSVEKKKSEDKTEKKKSEDKTEKKKSDDKGKHMCQYVMLKGERAGQLCGKAVNKKKSDKFCTAHFKE